MRIVTRPDLDGVVCAVLLYEAEPIVLPVRWIEPEDIQKGRAGIEKDDILANLPYDPNCLMWFDHHFTNRIDTPFRGAFRIAPSAAGIVYDYYNNAIKKNFDELVAHTDRIDSADLTREEVLRPQDNPYVLLSMTISGRNKADEYYWNLVVDLLRKHPIAEVMKNEDVARRAKAVIETNERFAAHLKNCTRVEGQVAVSDFRSLDKNPQGNRFLVYCLYPECVVSIRVAISDDDGEKVRINAGHSIFNKNCNVNVGKLMSMFGGGGHNGAGACSFHVSQAENNIAEIVKILKKNEPI